MNLRLSFSKLNTWENYSMQQAVDMINGVPYEPTPAMLEGTRVHQVIELERLNLLGLKESPQKWEYKQVVSFYDWLDFAFVIDFWAGDTIVDYKTGKSGDPMQLYVYALCMKMLGHDIDKGYLVWVDHNASDGIFITKKKEYTIGEEELLEAWLWVDHVSWQIRNYLEERPRTRFG